MILGKEKAPDRSDTRVAGEVGAGSTEIVPAELHRSGYVMKPASDHGLCSVGILRLGELGSVAEPTRPVRRARRSGSTATRAAELPLARTQGVGWQGIQPAPTHETAFARVSLLGQVKARRRRSPRSSIRSTGSLLNTRRMCFGATVSPQTVIGVAATLWSSSRTDSSRRLSGHQPVKKQGSAMGVA
jgi:hypothetical protein